MKYYVPLTLPRPRRASHRRRADRRRIMATAATPACGGLCAAVNARPETRRAGWDSTASSICPGEGPSGEATHGYGDDTARGAPSLGTTARRRAPAVRKQPAALPPPSRTYNKSGLDPALPVKAAWTYNRAAAKTQVPPPGFANPTLRLDQAVSSHPHLSPQAVGAGRGQRGERRRRP